jgi:hypothetical protein
MKPRTRTAIQVAIFLDPGKATFRRFQVALQQSAVAGRPPGRVQRYQVNRRRVRRGQRRSTPASGL